MCCFQKVANNCLELAARNGSQNSPIALSDKSLPHKSVVVLLQFLFVLFVSFGGLGWFFFVLVVLFFGFVVFSSLSSVFSS